MSRWLSRVKSNDKLAEAVTIIDKYPPLSTRLLELSQNMEIALSMVKDTIDDIESTHLGGSKQAQGHYRKPVITYNYCLRELLFQITLEAIERLNDVAEKNYATGTGNEAEEYQLEYLSHLVSEHYVVNQNICRLMLIALRMICPLKMNKWYSNYLLTLSYHYTTVDSPELLDLLRCWWYIDDLQLRSRVRIIKSCNRTNYAILVAILNSANHRWPNGMNISKDDLVSAYTDVDIEQLMMEPWLLVMLVATADSWKDNGTETSKEGSLDTDSSSNEEDE